jgi:CheY-like chemotaxis protein
MTKQILLADDSVTIQKVIELTFMEEDYRLVAVSNGDDAIDRLQSLTPDLVIADVHMPGASGMAVCERSKQLYPGVPVILLVGTFEPFDEEEAAGCGADAHLKKPFDSQELLHLVGRLMADGGGAAASALAEPLAGDEAALPLAGLDDLDLGDGEPEPVEEEEEPVPLAFEVDDDGGEPVAEPADEEPFELPSGRLAAEPDEEPVFELGTDDEDDLLAIDDEPLPELGEPDLEPLPSLGETESEPELELPAGFEEPDEEPFRLGGDTDDTAIDRPFTPGFDGETVSAEEAIDRAAAQAPSPPAVEDSAPAGAGGPLSDEDVDRIARRVAEMVGERVIREVAWEVVPDLAEVVIKDRLRELEGQID